VLGTRTDGYHELRTTFQSLSLHDTLTVEHVRGPFAMTSDDPRCPTDASNLVWKAAAGLWHSTGRRASPANVRVHLQKRIPMEAGLGGGSSDAAATLLALRALWGLDTPDAELQAIAGSLGADVPFFLSGGTVLGLERGDLLFPLIDAEPAWVVIARPDFGVSTPEAFRWWDEAHQSDAARSGHHRRPDAINDLQAPVCLRHPRISKLVKALSRSGARRAAMSGSGSAVFGLFETRAAALAGAASLKSNQVATWVTRTTTRSQHSRASAPQPLR
jgi:4-diphosphocytidyl-2-C-methyl-D-erythritol kinase